jgi:DNA-binding MarR family transcriptional regulator
MIITFTKEQTSDEFIKEMENKHGTIESLEKKIEKEYNALKVVDLDSWKFLKENPEETIKKTHTKVTNNLKTLDLSLLEIIKKEHPKSLTELAKIVEKDVSVIQRKINNLKKTGFVELKEGNINNMKMPIVNYDKIEIAI